MEHVGHGCPNAVTQAMDKQQASIPSDTERQEGTFVILHFMAVSAALSEPTQTTVSFYSIDCRDNLHVSGVDRFTIFTPIDFVGDLIYTSRYDTTWCILREFGSVLNVTKYVSGTVTIER